MYNYPYQMPYIASQSIPRMGMGINGMNKLGGANIFGKLSNSIKSFNLGGFIDNTNKTLNVVNQAIPLVRNVGPMVRNVRDVMRIANVFKSETKTNDNYSESINVKVSSPNELNSKKTKNVDNSCPTFFV